MGGKKKKNVNTAVALFVPSLFWLLFASWYQDKSAALSVWTSFRNESSSRYFEFPSFYRDSRHNNLDEGVFNYI